MSIQRLLRRFKGFFFLRLFSTPVQRLLVASDVLTGSKTLVFTMLFQEKKSPANCQVQLQLNCKWSGKCFSPISSSPAHLSTWRCSQAAVWRCHLRQSFFNFSHRSLKNWLWLRLKVYIVQQKLRGGFGVYVTAESCSSALTTVTEEMDGGRVRQTVYSIMKAKRVCLFSF